MLLFAICEHCQAEVNNRQTLDIAPFIEWKCDKCGAINKPISASNEKPEDGAVPVEWTEYKAIIEQVDAQEYSAEENILEGCK